AENDCKEPYDYASLFEGQERCPHVDNRYTYLNITVSTSQNVQAIGKLVFNDDNGHHEQILGTPLLVYT
ncbi:17521_t:CDS:2, partial [Racocetra fulgida]